MFVVVVVGFFSFFLALLLLLLSQFQSSSEKTRREKMKQVVRERDGPVMSGRSRNISAAAAAAAQLINICTLGVKDIDEATRNEMANKNKSNTTKTQWNVASSLGKKKPVQLGRQPSKKCILNYTALNES
jgi:hypothetical protein